MIMPEPGRCQYLLVIIFIAMAWVNPPINPPGKIMLIFLRNEYFNDRIEDNVNNSATRRTALVPLLVSLKSLSDIDNSNVSFLNKWN